MRLAVDVNVYLHPDKALIEIVGGRFDEVMKVLSNLEKRDIQMNDKMTTVIGGIGPRLTSIDSTLASVLAFVNEGVKPIVAAAVSKALADNDVEEAAAAASVDAALTDVEQHLQPIVDAMKANTPDAGAPAVVVPVDNATAVAAGDPAGAAVEPAPVGDPAAVDPAAAAQPVSDVL